MTHLEILSNDGILMILNNYCSLIFKIDIDIVVIYTIVLIFLDIHTKIFVDEILCCVEFIS